MHRKMFFAVLISAAMLTACAEGDNDNIVTESVTVSFTSELPANVTGAPETAKKNILGDYTEEVTEETEPELPEEYRTIDVDIGGKSYYFNPYSGALLLYDFEGRIADCIDDIKALEPKSVTVYSKTPDDREAELLMTELLGCEILYGGKELDFDLPEEDGFCFYMQPTVNIYNTGDIYWERDRYICADFSNYSDEDVTAETMRIFYDDGGTWTEVPFADGGYELAVNITVEAGHIADHRYDNGYEFALTEELFDYESARDGHYKAVFTCKGEEKESEFYINKAGGWTIPDSTPVPDFLTEEQFETVKSSFAQIAAWELGSDIKITAEYASSHTFEDFYSEYFSSLTYDCAYRFMQYREFIDKDGNLAEMYSGGFPGSVTYAGSLLLPVYSDENEVIMKFIIVRHHWDNPYSLSHDISTCRLVKDGNEWKTDIFPALYG